MKIICFGNRGSRALGASMDSPFGLYGGDTTAIGIFCDDGTIIGLDAGSGAWKWPYTFKNTLGMNGPIKMHMFFSHYHDDHKTGFPQLEQLFIPGNKFHFWGPRKKDLYPTGYPKAKKFNLKRMFHQKSSADNPNLTDAYNAEIKLQTIPDNGPNNNSIDLSDSVTVSWIRVKHGGQHAYGYRIDNNGMSFSMISDTHHTVDISGQPQLNTDVINFIQGSDIFMSDCHFTDEEFNNNPDFCGAAMGHSTGEHGVRLSDAADVPIFMPHHYAPTKTDTDLDQEMNELRQYAQRFKNVSIIASQPSLVVDLSVPAEKRVQHMLMQSTPALRQQALQGTLSL